MCSNVYDDVTCFKGNFDFPSNGKHHRILDDARMAAKYRAIRETCEKYMKPDVDLFAFSVSIKNSIIMFLGIPKQEQKQLMHSCWHVTVTLNVPHFNVII